MKPFNIDAAKNGAAVCTRNGLRARIICWDRRGDHPIVALIDDGCDGENVCYYTVEGCAISKIFRNNEDLFMEPVEHVAYSAIYKHQDGDVDFETCATTLWADEKECRLQNPNAIAIAEVKWRE